MSHRSSLIAIVAGVATLGVASNALAFDVKHTPNGSLVHWESDKVEFSIDSSLDAIGNSHDAVTNAFDSWSGHEGAPLMSDSGVNGPSAPGYDGKNGVFYMPSGYAPAGKALAITVLTYDNNTGRALDADIIVNGIYKFQVLPEAVNSAHTNNATSGATDGVSQGDGADQGDVGAVYDLPHVLAHETGHSLGMNDEYVNGGALMYRYTAPNDPSLRAPQVDDFEGLSQLYGTAMHAGGGCGGATVSPVKPSSKAGSLAFALGLGLVAFVVLRRRQGSRAKTAGAFISIAAFAIVSVPQVSGSVARANQVDASQLRGHATATVTTTRTTTAAGLFRTEMQLQTSECRIASCPKIAAAATWGGTMDNITQEVDGAYVPRTGDAVDVSFERAPSALSALASPLAAHDSVVSSVVRVITKAR